MPSQAVSKAVRRLEEGLANHEYYESQQVVKTVYWRNRTRKLLDDSYDLLVAASQAQLTQGQDSCGAELAMLLLQAFQEDSVPASPARIQPVLDILLSFPGKTSPRCTALTPDLCSRYALEALKWLRTQPQQQAQQPGESNRILAACEQIHLHLAIFLSTFYGAPGLGWAGPHFALSHDPTAFAHAVAAAVSADPEPPEHLYLARGALQVMASTPDIVQAQRSCRSFLDQYKDCRGGQLPTHPLISCLKLLMLALTESDYGLVKLARREYEPALAQDEMLLKLLDEIEQVHFGVRPAGGGLGDMLASMFSS